MTVSPWLMALRKKMRAKLLAMTARTPTWRRPLAGCSRELPQPKYSPARTRSPGFTSLAKSASRSSKRWGAISSGVEQV